jgi:hypothetical protein
MAGANARSRSHAINIENGIERPTHIRQRIFAVFVETDAYWVRGTTRMKVEKDVRFSKLM